MVSVASKREVTHQTTCRVHMMHADLAPGDAEIGNLDVRNCRHFDKG